MKNQENHTPLDLAVAEDVRSLLQDAMTTHQSLPAVTTKAGNKIINLPSTSASSSGASASSLGEGSGPNSGISNETVIMPSGNPFLMPIRSLLSSGGGDGDTGEDGTSEKILTQMKCFATFLSSLSLDHLREIFEREQISLDILAEMTHDDLKGIGVLAYGHRHLLLKGIDKWRTTMGGGTMLIELPREDREFLAVEEEMQATIRNHRDMGHAGGIFSRYTVVKIQKVRNPKLWERYIHRRTEVGDENGREGPNEKMLFHGSPFIAAIVHKGFDERHAYIGEHLFLCSPSVVNWLTG
jgi:tankyrase